MKLANIIFLLEAKEDFIASKYAAKLEQAYQIDTHEEKPAIEIVNMLCQADPSKKCLEWIVKCYINRNFKIEEDIEQVKQDLIKFNEVRRNLEQKDINSYNSLRDLRIALDSTSTILTGDIDKQYEELIQQGQCSTELLSGKIRIYKFVDGSEKSLTKMCQGASWCTRNEGTAQKYLKEGPVYQLLVGSERYQLHFESTQFMDVHDFAIKFDEFDDNTKNILIKWMLHTGKIKNEDEAPMFCWKEKTILHVLDLALNDDKAFSSFINNYINFEDGDMEGKQSPEWWLMYACNLRGPYKQFVLRNLNKILDVVKWPDNGFPPFPNFNITSSGVDIFSKHPSLLAFAFNITSKSPTTIIKLISSLNEKEDNDRIIVGKCWQALAEICDKSASLKEQLKNNNAFLQLMKEHEKKYYCPELVCLMCLMGELPYTPHLHMLGDQIEAEQDEYDHCRLRFSWTILPLLRAHSEPFRYSANTILTCLHLHFSYTVDEHLTDDDWKTIGNTCVNTLQQERDDEEEENPLHTLIHNEYERLLRKLQYDKKNMIKGERYLLSVLRNVM